MTDQALMNELFGRYEEASFAKYTYLLRDERLAQVATKCALDDVMFEIRQTSKRNGRYALEVLSSYVEDAEKAAYEQQGD